MSPPIPNEIIRQIAFIEKQLKDGNLSEDIILDIEKQLNKEPSFEDNMKKFAATLHESFPGISESVVKKYVVFTELLEEYNKPTIVGITKFLENKGYELDGLKSEDRGTNFTEEETNKIYKGKLLLGLKRFSEWDRGEEKIISYLILAKKKNKWGIAGIKNAFEDLMNSNSQESMS